MKLSPPNKNVQWQDIVHEYGLPLYIYDGNKINEQYDQLVDAFPTENLQIHYACKANSNNQIIKLLKGFGAKLDTVSWNEVRLGLACGYEPADIHFTPNGAPLQEYFKAIEAGCSLSVDSLPVIEAIAENYPGQKLCIRINPNLMAGGHFKIAVGHKLSKFGLSKEHVRHILHMHEKGKICVNGVHAHTGSDIIDIEAYRKAFQQLMESALLFRDTIEYLDLGGGFKVPYAPDEKSIDIKSIGHWMVDEIQSSQKNFHNPIRIYIEPGKFLVSEAGYFLARVSQLKESYGTKFAYLKAGFNHFIRPMYYDAIHHITQLSNPQGVKETYNIVGYLCETDTFASNRKLPEISIGDVLAFHNAGAYSYIMASNYNMREKPAEVLILNGNVKLIQKREQFEDLIKGQVWE